MVTVHALYRRQGVNFSPSYVRTLPIDYMSRVFGERLLWPDPQATRVQISVLLEGACDSKTDSSRGQVRA